MSLLNDTTDFKASLSIANLSPLSQQMQSVLPSDYTRSQNSGNYALIYGTGYEMENVKQVIGQYESNNYLYTPSLQTGNITVSGSGSYLIEFDLPYIIPPLDVGVSASEFTDVFIEFTSQYGMTINVKTAGTDIVSWTANGTIGAANSEILGDALYNNWGSIYNLPRLGDSVADDTFVSQYENFNLFINVQKMTTVINIPSFVNNNQIIYNSPPLNSQIGIIRPTTVITDPTAAYELVNSNGQIIALLTFDVNTFTIGTSSFGVSSFEPSNLANSFDPNHILPTYEVYVSGTQTTFSFDRWDQPSWKQEVFRADNKYRRLLTGVNRALLTGPSVNGMADIIEAIFGQPHIPHQYWDQSDFRVFENSPNLSTPKFISYETGTDGLSSTIVNVLSQTQYDGYPAVPPVVEVLGVGSSWTPDSITYANKPIMTTLADVPPVQIDSLNAATTFDITNEIIRQLRVGIDISTGGIVEWNYLLNANNTDTSIYQTGQNFQGQNYSYNYFFLNNATDSISNLILFYYQKIVDQSGNPIRYMSYGPLVYNKDYFIVDTNSLYDATSNNGLGGYNLPSELLVNYSANSNLPALETANGLVAGQPYIAEIPSNKPTLPSSVIQLNLGAYIQQYFPMSVDDFIIYTYNQINITPGVVNGHFKTVDGDPSTVEYYDSQSTASIQPSDSPFINLSVAISQGSFARFISESNFEFVLSMAGGQVTFNKTVYASDLLLPTSTNLSQISPAGILILNSNSAVAQANNAPQIYQNIVGNIYQISGKIITNLQLNNITNQMVPYYQIDNVSYLLTNESNQVIAILSNESSINLKALANDGNTYLFTGTVNSLLWDTRIPVTDYYDTSPVYQVSDNFNTQILPITPNLSVPILPVNKNFLAIISGLPAGNQQTVTASWTFNVVQTTPTLGNIPNVSALTFADRKVGNVIIDGIMTYFTGAKMLRPYNGIDQFGIDPDNATYLQTFVSQNFGAYFLDYKDIVYTNYGNGVIGNKLSAQGDRGNLDTVFNKLTTPPNYASILNFFSPIFGFISFSILPGIQVYNIATQQRIPINRPNNNGIALRIKGDSYAGLTFYGLTTNKIVDKPMRLLLDYTYGASALETRHRIIEIADNSYANWVDGFNPNEVQDNSIFYIAGNQFKYSGMGLDQAYSQYNDNAPGQPQSAEHYLPQSLYGLNATPPSYETNIGQLIYSTPSTLNLASPKGTDGYPQRYRRPPVIQIGQNGSESFDPSYYNITPEKIAFLQFDFSTFAVDSLVEQAILEIYFCSGFTIIEGRNKDFTLNNNQLWNKSRLSGNGTTKYKNVHWRKNYFEIVLPYAFLSQDTNQDYGIANLFSTTPNTAFSALPPSNLEYLGFINLDEIGVFPVPTGSFSQSAFYEQTQGLTNLILTNKSIIRQVTGTLSLNNSGNIDISPLILPLCSVIPPGSLQSCENLINQKDVLPNMKVLVFPFGDNADANGIPDPNAIFIYGYVKSIFPASIIGFDSLNISLYEKLISYVCPLYAQYNVKLLEADTYFPFTIFGKTTAISDTVQDISF